MVQGIASLPGSFYKYCQVFLDILLTGKTAEVSRAKHLFGFFFRWSKGLARWVKIVVHHRLIDEQK
jgi:hypothetical protein